MPRPTDLLDSIERQASAIFDIFPDGSQDFYAVVVGSPSGIHHTRAGAKRSEGKFSHPRWIHTQNFWEALALMIVKGIDDLMPLIPCGGVITADGFESNSAGPSRRLLQPRGYAYSSVPWTPVATARSQHRF
ncbi:hypothetical protein JVT61DRAFT_1829 [Boletus reticuloceps]|uniref:Uncharacterized protein n=1 Tax=Boletus reticuloceps TaxID=495285 RepID=A0A8I2YPY5_9AGAM|nr:hypothetical protein JVT61DRAFT_1829 [Boletus reticuloceps]